MTIKEARKIVKDFQERNNPSEDERFLFIEAMNFIIEEEKDPWDMMYLGGYYYEHKNFDLALKYYEMAATYDYDDAFECLGYIWYYGRTGERDFKKAYFYFSKMMEKGNVVATYKIADMYKNGYYVEKNYDKYVEIIEELYPLVKECENCFDPIPEVYTRLARIRSKQGRNDEAVSLYLDAKAVLAERIQYDAYFGNMNIMKWLIDDLYELIPFDYEKIDLFDLYYLLKSPHEIKLSHFFNGEVTEVELRSVQEGDVCEVFFNGKWYHDRDDFFARAEYLYSSFRHLYIRFWDIEVVQ